VGFAELSGVYQRLRSELDAAYAGPVWNSSQIDLIAEQLAEVEFALATGGRSAHLASAFRTTTAPVDHDGA